MSLLTKSRLLNWRNLNLVKASVTEKLFVTPRVSMSFTISSCSSQKIVLQSKFISNISHCFVRVTSNNSINSTRSLQGVNLANCGHLGRFNLARHLVTSSKLYSAGERGGEINNDAVALDGHKPRDQQSVSHAQDNVDPSSTGTLITDAKCCIVFTCKVCNTRSSKLFSKHSYEKGIVIIRCPGCESLHLIADNLGWFSHFEHRNIEQMLAAKGEDIQKFNDGTLELTLEDITGPVKNLPDSN